MGMTPGEKKAYNKGFEAGENSVEEGLPGWFGTFADMMTLLFAFFVLLYSLSSPDPVKVSQMQDGMGDQPKLKSFNAVTEEFEEIIDDLNIGEKAKVSRDPRGVTLEIDGDICFESGSTILHETLTDILNQASKKVFAQADDYRLIIVEGHTDSDKIPKALKPAHVDIFDKNFTGPF